MSRRRLLGLVGAAMAVTAATACASTPPPAPGAPVTTPATGMTAGPVVSEDDHTWNTYRPLPSAELLDTATTGTPLSSSTPLSVQVTGVGGVPASGVIAVVLDLTTANAQSATPVTVAPLGEGPGITAHVTTPGHQARTTAYVAPGENGSVQLSADGPATDLTVVVTGYITERGPGASFVPASAPARLLDTRAAAVLEPGVATTLELPDDAPSGTTAAAVNVETTSATHPGTLSITGTAPREAVKVAYDTITASTGLVAQVSDAGELVVTNDGPSPAHVTVDLQGYFVPATEGGSFVPTPATAYDSRAEAAPIPPGGVLDVPVAGTGQVPYDDGVTAYAIAVTVVSGATAGDVRIYPASQDPSSTATVAFGADDRRTTTALISSVYPFAPSEVAIENRSDDDVHVLVDVMGYFDAALPEYVPLDDLPMAVEPAEPVTMSQTCVVSEDGHGNETRSCYSTEDTVAQEGFTYPADPTRP